MLILFLPSFEQYRGSCQLNQKFLIEKKRLSAFPFCVPTFTTGISVFMLCHVCPLTTPRTQWVFSLNFIAFNLVQITWFHCGTSRSFLRKTCPASTSLSRSFELYTFKRQRDSFIPYSAYMF